MRIPKEHRSFGSANAATLLFILLSILSITSTSAFQVGNRVMAVAGGANVRDGTLANILFQQYGGVYGTITSSAITGTAGGYTGNWWKINWDSEPPDQGGYQGYSAESVIALAPLAGDVAEPNLANSYYTTQSPYFPSYAPDSIGGSIGSLGNCTWYAYSRMLELGYSQSLLNAFALHDAYTWAANAQGVSGVTVDNNPAIASIAELDSGDFSSKGHVAVVESVNADGTITVTESSYSTASSSVWNFLWRHRTVTPNWFSHFIHVARTGTPPSATTQPATSITSSGATLNSSVNPNGLSTIIQFEYGLTTSYGSTTAPGNIGTTSGSYGAAITGLSPNTLYHYQIMASSSGGTSDGGDLTFITSPINSSGAIFSDNFTGNSIDVTKWTTLGNTVLQTNETMEVLTTVTDAGGSLTSVPFSINPTGKVTISRQTFLHYGNDDFIGAFLMKVDSQPWCGVDYANMDYSDGVTYMPCHGFFLIRNGTRADSIQSQSDISNPIAPLWDTWFNEEVTYDPTTGVLEYLTNDVSAFAFNVGIPPTTNVHTMTLSFNSWGWYTGHEQLFKNLVVFQAPPVAFSSQLTGVSISTNAMFLFNLNGSIGSNYVVQASSNLVDWINESTNFIPAGGTLKCAFPVQSSQTQTFYRALLWH